VSAYRSRGTGDLRRAFTFGGRVPFVLGLILVAILAATVASWVVRDQSWAVLAPDRVVRGELWRLVSWVFVQDHPLTLLFGGLALYSFGLQLAYDWSQRRFLWTFLGLAAGASAVTVAVALASPEQLQPVFRHLGMWPVVNALILMWAMRFPDQQLNFWGIIPLTGRTVILLLVFGTVLYGLAAGGVVGLLGFTPHFAALAIGFGLSRGRFPTRRWRMQWRDYWSERSFRRKAKHLKVVRKNGDSGPSQWLN
jgi:membrane associated rhomboid family serine protease